MEGNSVQFAKIVHQHRSCDDR